MPDGIFWVLATGAPWRDLPERFGPFQSVHRYFSQWRKAGVFARVVEALQVKLRQPRAYRLGPVVHRRRIGPRHPGGGRGRQKSAGRHPGEPADHALGRSRGGSGSKFHVVTDGHGTPLAVGVTAGQVHDSTQAEAVIGRATATLIGRRRRERRRRHKPRRLAGDKGYSCHRLRDWRAGQGIDAVIPHKDNELARHDPGTWFDKWAYRGRCVVEQCVGWLKESRRICTRFEKLAVNFHGMLRLAMIDQYFRLLF